MQMSFIVTTYNVASYIEQCLASVLNSARPGDEVLIVDDGSTDATPALIRRFITLHGTEDIQWRPIFLGTNTHGGVGIPANIGLRHARGASVFFVDGDDWLEPDMFRNARRHFEETDDDVMLANYYEFDERRQQRQAPSDSFRWPEVASLDVTAPQGNAGNGDVAPLARRLQALKMIAAPWRKFYRRQLFVAHDIRFAEGPFFFEDNPLHWDVCLKAERIGFLNVPICYHRVNRPGQTMMVRDQRLTAFFDHYDRIAATLPPLDIEAPDTRAQHAALMDWLINNMIWHLQRMAPDWYWTYATRAAQTLKGFDDTVWTQDVAPQYVHSPIGIAADQLRTATASEVVMLWNADRQLQMTQEMNARVAKLENLAQDVRSLEKLTDRLEVLRAHFELRALQKLEALSGQSS